MHRNKADNSESIFYVEVKSLFIATKYIDSSNIKALFFRSIFELHLFIVILGAISVPIDDDIILFQNIMLFVLPIIRYLVPELGALTKI